MANSLNAVCSILGIDRVDVIGKIMVVKEQHGSNGNFVINAVISNAVKNNQAICLVLFHNTFAHYYNIGMRLGYNLCSLKEKGELAVIESMKLLSGSLSTVDPDQTDWQNVILKNDSKKLNSQDWSLTMLKHLLNSLKNKYNELRKLNKKIVLVIDDLSHLFNLGLSLHHTMFYVKYIRSLIQTEPLSHLCILTHEYESNSEYCDTRLLVNGLCHMAHLLVTIEVLKSGHSRDASGKIKVSWKIDSIRKQYHWTESSTHLYKLMDWKVNIFAPGTTTFL